MAPRLHPTIVALATLALALAAAPAQAHPGHKRSSRLLLVDLTAEPPSLRYGLVFEPAASDAGRKRADQDGDGAVSAAEGQAELERLTAEVRSSLSLCRGPTLEGVSCSGLGEDQVAGALATGWDEKPGRTLALTWEFQLGLVVDDRVVRVEDASFVPDVDRTDAKIEVPEAWRLVAAGQVGGGPGSRVTRELLWGDDRPSEPRKLFLVWEPPAPRWWAVAAVGAVGLLLAGHLVLSRRRQQRAAPA